MSSIYTQKNKLLKIALCFLLLFFSFAHKAFATNTPRYWVGGTGSWSTTDTTHWSDSSGGAGGQSVPDSDDDVYFNANSNEATDAAYTVTAGGGGVVNAANLSFARAGDPTTGGVVTITGSTNYISVYGNMTLHSGQVFSYSSGLYFAPAVSVTALITSNGVRISATIAIIGEGTVRLADTFNTARNFTLTTGTFDASTNSATVLLSSNTDAIITGAFTGSSAFYNLTRTPLTAAKTNTLTLAGNIEVTNTFTVSNGATVTNRVLVYSSVRGTARTITAAAIATSNSDWQDITGAGAASWDLSAISGGSGNCGNNSMKALGDAAFTTAQTQYWTADASASDNWSDATNWDASDHSTAQRVPLCQDDVIFDAGSFAGDGKTVVGDMPRFGKTLDFRDTDQTFTWTTNSSNASSIFGGLYLDDNITMNNSSAFYWVFEGRGAYELLSIGKTFNRDIYIDAPGGSITLLDALNHGSSLFLIKGTFDANDQNVTITRFYSFYTTTRTLYMGSGLWTMTGNVNIIWEVGYTNLTNYAESSTVKFTYH